MSKISFDLDGTYLEYPDTFDAMAVMLQASGHEVGILTARSEDLPDGHPEAKNGGYVEVGFEPDFEYYLGLKDDENTPQEKAMEKTIMIQQENIDIHYDDEYQVFPDYIKEQIIEID